MEIRYDDEKGWLIPVDERLEKAVIGATGNMKSAMNILKHLEGKASSLPQVSKQTSPKDLATMPSRTITVVAETVTWWDKERKRKYYKMESGRMAAQVGHAISKLKMSYVILNSNKDTKALDVAKVLERTPITSIILKARDSEELGHIISLCEEKLIHAVEFWDDNPDIYGQGIQVRTAVSIGPIHPAYLAGITDYLPLWQDNNSSL